MSFSVSLKFSYANSLSSKIESHLHKCIPRQSTMDQFGNKRYPLVLNAYGHYFVANDEIELLKSIELTSRETFLGTYHTLSYDKNC